MSCNNRFPQWYEKPLKKWRDNMVLKESQFRELIRGIVREVIFELGDIGTSSGMSSVGATPALELDPAAQQERERELRKTNRSEVQQQQKALKFQKQKHEADKKMFKMTKKSAEDKIRNLKRSGV